jgi:predicted acylesterase/phospholipase RssA
MHANVGRTMQNDSNEWDVSEDLRKRASEVRTLPTVDSLIAALQGKRIGLVLAGGGAKGAFQAGALLALTDLGLIKYEVIAGTSVGALNAVLFQHASVNRDRKVLAQMWTEMRLGKIMRMTPMILLQFFMALCYSLVLAVHLRPPKDPRHDADFDIMLVHAVGWFALTMGGLVLIVQLVIYTDLQIVQIAVLLVLLTVLVPVIDWIISRALGMTPSLASNMPMREAIDDLGAEQIVNDQPPIVCTLGHNVSFGPPLANALRGAIYPLYLPLAEASTKEVSEVLLLSAGLPYIFASRRVHGKWCVDGGLVDNVPLLGVFLHDQNNPVDAVIAIYLSKRSAAHQYEASRCMKLAARAMYGGAEVRAIDLLLERWLRKTEFLSIHPRTNLRSAVGTLDFRRSRARTLIEIGYRETLDQIQAMALTQR